MNTKYTVILHLVHHWSLVCN